MTKTPTAGYAAAAMSYAMSRAAGIAGGTPAVAATEAAIVHAAGKDKTPTPPSRTMQEAWMGYSMSRAAGIAGGTPAVAASEGAIRHAAEKAEGVVGRPVGFTWLFAPPTVAQRTAEVSPTIPPVTVVEKIITIVQEGNGVVQEGGTPVSNGNGGGGDAWEEVTGMLTQRNMLIGGAAIAAIAGIAVLSRRKK